MNPKNKKALADFCACTPESMRKSAAASSIRNRFVVNGMIDKETKSCPSWDKMIKTIPRKQSEKIQKRFKQLQQCENSTD